MKGQATVHISASPDDVYALVADVANMGKWSPECTECVWTSDARGVGATFTGRNRIGPVKWSTTPTVTVDEPGKAFAFSTGSTEWRYDFAPTTGGTQVTESYDIKLSRVSLLLHKVIRRDKTIDRGMARTLAKLKEAAEADT